MITIFDTETTGLIKNWKAPVTQVDNFPRIIQLAWMVTDLEGKILKEKEVLIKPNGWTMPVDAFWIEHGFSQEQSMSEGVEIVDALIEFIGDMEASEWLVSHNMDFDHKVTAAEMIRHDMTVGKKINKICTKEEATDFCKIPFANSKETRPWMQQRYKWPRLSELHFKLFGHGFEDAHSAGGDVLALKNCFFELVKLGVIRLELPNV